MSKQTILVLSGGVTKSGKLPFYVKNSLNHAYALYNKGIVKNIVVSGKWSYRLDFNPAKTEAQAMADYLIEFGIPKSVIIKESLSQDLISSVFYVYTTLLKPRKITDLLIITSDFQQQRAQYVFDRLIGKKITLTYESVFSNLTPDMLWDFYTYEQQTLLKTKGFLKKYNTKNLSVLEKTFYSASFYTKLSSGHVRSMVAARRIGRKSSITKHYSLPRIFNIRKEVFQEYGLHAKNPRTLKADFWSGRFLNFLGRGEDNEYYCLKFCLMPKDRIKFKKEIVITKALAEKDIRFVPMVLASNIENGPYWYIYKVVRGSMAGKFSNDFSFKPSFYSSQTRTQLITHLRSLREVNISRASRFGSETYNARLGKTMLNLRRHKSLLPKDLTHFEQVLLHRFPLLEKANTYLSHNDLHPGNIIFSTSAKTIYFIDLEYVAYNNIAFDFCFLYIFSWDKPTFQQMLYDEFFESLTLSEQRDFKTIFPTVYGLFLLWLLDYVEAFRYRSTEDRYKKAKAHILSELAKL